MYWSRANPAILRIGLVVVKLTSIQGKEEARTGMPGERFSEHLDYQETQGPLKEITLDALYERFRRPIHSYTYRLLGNQEDADDVTQEVFVRACNSWDGLYERTHLSSWLYRIATNLCVDLLRRRKRISWWSLSYRNAREESAENAETDEVARLLADSGGIPEVAEREMIRLTLARMPEEYAIVLVLSAAQGIPYQEIAQIIGVSPSATATRISRAKKMFIDQYQRLSKESVGKQERPK